MFVDFVIFLCDYTLTLRPQDYCSLNSVDYEVNLESKKKNS